MRQISAFASEIAKSLSGYLTSGIVMACVFLYEHYTRISVSWAPVEWGVGIGLLVACFAAWRAKDSELAKAHTRITALQAQLDEERRLRTPNLVGKIEQTIVGLLSREREREPIAHIQVSIANPYPGAPSVVEGWRLRVNIGTNSYEGRPLVIRDGTQLSLVPGCLPEKVILDAKDALYEKTVQPIQQGGRERGWLKFEFAGPSQTELMSLGAQWILSFRDVNSREYTATYVYTSDLRAPLAYYPGAGGLRP